MPEGKINKNETCHVACDHYHHWREDVEHMKGIGLQAYRFSISWSRVIPSKNKINEAGLKFYSDLVDALVAAGIKPMITLFHSDMPQWVFDEGGWLNEEVENDFAFFAKTMCKALSDRVEYWFTMNEPQCFHADCLDLAGKKGDEETAKLIWKNILHSHGRAVSVLRENAKQPLKIGHVIMGMAVEPVPGALPEERAYELFCSEMAGWMSQARWLDPMINGTVPQSLEGYLSEDDFAVIHQPMDLFCVNVYGSMNFYDNPGRDNPLSYPGIPKSQIGMPIRPKSLYYMAKFAYQRYQLPVLFTENGFSCADFIMLDGKVHDTMRIDYIHRYLLELKKALEEGIPVEGYLYWSIMDNFEWFHGYDMRFGLIYIDYPTQTRTLKDSAYYFKTVIETNGENL